MDRSLAEEARALLEAARPWVEEWVEEGVDRFERLAAPEVAAADPAPSPAPPEPAPPEPAPTSRPAPSRPPQRPPVAPAAPEPQAPLLGGERLWGEAPTLDEVRAALGDCTRCGLCQGRRNIVFGDGATDADIMFIGEGPGEQEDLRGLPFVGRAGELLTAMIEKGMGLARESVYICNIVKCRPPNNRNPLPDEVAACRPFLDGQIEAVRPRVIVSLGKPAASLLLGRDVAITRVRGTWQEYRGIPLMPTLHPAYILRQYTQENRRLVWEDLKSALARSREG
ncbi:MAG: uracil-DNA glycosylase [Myxococcota bacterium]